MKGIIQVSSLPKVANETLNGRDTSEFPQHMVSSPVQLGLSQSLTTPSSFPSSEMGGWHFMSAYWLTLLHTTFLTCNSILLHDMVSKSLPQNEISHPSLCCLGFS